NATSAMQISALASHMATITSSAQLTRYMKMTPPQENLLSVLSEAARKRFLESLTFNEKGITGYRYAELESELTPTKIAKILSLFGSQANTTLFKKAVVKTEKDQRLLAGETPVLMCPKELGGEGGEGGEGSWGGDFGGGGIGGGGAGSGGVWATPTPTPYPTGPSVPQDYMGYTCVAPGSCKASRSDICLKTC
ncbi:hypothetical protein PO883_33610, partial [Massilia sp. DJPM01]|uniref:hypothetical protein n=1 Tax=Massilia sp. DJPM01 TaxID=3024404 RepID=UPI00259ECB5F